MLKPNSIGAVRGRRVGAVVRPVRVGVAIRAVVRSPRRLVGAIVKWGDFLVVTSGEPSESGPPKGPVIIYKGVAREAVLYLGGLGGVSYETAEPFFSL